MLQQTLSATPLDAMVPWLALAAFGAYHGLNPGMGWLFALSLGLQQRSERAIWVSMFPIAAGHAASLALVAVLVLGGAAYLPAGALQFAMALVLIGFGLYKVFNYYRHPRWVGMKVSLADLTWWSFLMAMAHGAGLMIAPALLSIATTDHGVHAHGAHQHAGPATPVFDVFLGLMLHTGAMLVAMGLLAWLVYKYVGLAVLRRNWVNFDLLWAIALLLVGGLSLLPLL